MTTKPQDPNYMTPQRRELYFKIIDNYRDIHPITWRLHFLEEHFPPHQLDTALKWLVSHQIVGVKFLSWYEVECKRSDLEMHRLLLTVVQNVKLQPIIAGRNFRV